MRRSLRRALLRGVTASVVLPMVIAVVVGTAALLSSLGDRAGAVGAVRVAQVGAVAWVVAIVATAVLGGLAALDDGHGRGEAPPWRRRGPPWAPPDRERPNRREPRHGRRRRGRRPDRSTDAPEAGASGRIAD